MGLSLFLSLPAHLFPNPGLQTPYQPVFSTTSLSLSLLPICLFSASDRAEDSPLAYITKNMAFTQSAHTHKHICHISLFHHRSLDPSFAISNLSLCGFVWMHCGCQQSFEIHIHRASMPPKQVVLAGLACSVREARPGTSRQVVKISDLCTCMCMCMHV